MKGTFFQKPFEFALRIDGESWRQGDEIRGTLEIKKHGGDEQGGDAAALAQARVHLAWGGLKKVRQKSPDAFEILESSGPAGKGTSVSFAFRTDRNCPITDASGSLFALYGLGDATEKLGQLQLPMHAHAIFEAFLGTIGTDFRFVQKSRKSSKGFVEVKLAPPDAKAFSTLELLTLGFRFGENETLELRYQFQVRKIEATAAAVDVKKAKKAFEQELRREEYLLPSGRINHERMEAAIRQALESVESKVLY